MPVPQPHVPLPGSHREPPVDARAVAAVDPQQEMTVTVYLRRRNEDEFRDYLEENVGRASHRAGRHLSHRELAERFGAGEPEMEAVERFASTYGLRVERRDPARRMVRLQGRAEQFVAAFRVTMQTYETRGQVFRAREGTIQVPPHLLDVVIGVFGFDHRPQAVPHFRIKGSGAPAGAAPRAVSGPSFNPTDLADLYQFPAGVSGAGETIGIIELGGGYTPDDLQTYFAQLGINPAPSVTSVSVDGGQNQPGDPTGADGEVELDIEVAGAIAPGANQKVFFAPNTDQGFLDAVTQAVQDPDVTIISISWGQAESGWTSQALTSFNQAFQDAAALGKTVFAAAGDNGSTDGQSDGQNHVDFPASSPYVAGCGGTTLQTSGGQITSETVWNELASGDGATGGGVSAVFPLPGYQQNVGVPPAPTAAGGRGVPDVAADADPETGYNVLVDGQPTVVGGTSAVAPLYAGLFALINQTLHAQGKPRAGFVQPVLYANAPAFHDITQGNNGAFSAGPGWDATTGLGSPIGRQILAAFLQNATS
ncbi:MAG: S8/S53 family peptidase [Verrucomicrobia bacterium]|nr:S8/S53 family peptidase [Verrucomicrobiota bacterium]